MNLEKIPQEVRKKIPPELLDHLAQELNKPIFGEKTIEEHMPALCRRAAAEGAVLLKNQGGVLRGEWGYEGCVMTDWWMRQSPDPDFENVWDSAYRIRAQVDVLMPGGIDQKGSPDSSALESYQKGGLTLAELQRGAKNVLRYILHSNALNRAEA